MIKTFISLAFGVSTAVASACCAAETINSKRSEHESWSYVFKDRKITFPAQAGYVLDIRKNDISKNSQRWYKVRMQTDGIFADVISITALENINTDSKSSILDTMYEIVNGFRKNCLSDLAAYHSVVVPEELVITFNSCIDFKDASYSMANVGLVFKDEVRAYIISWTSTEPHGKLLPVQHQFWTDRLHGLFPIRSCRVTKLEDGDPEHCLIFRPNKPQSEVKKDR